MAEDTPYPSENLVSPVTCWTDLKRRRQKSFKNEKRKTKKKQRKKNFATPLTPEELTKV